MVSLRDIARSALSGGRFRQGRVPHVDTADHVIAGKGEYPSHRDRPPHRLRGYSPSVPALLLVLGLIFERQDTGWVGSSPKP